MKKKKLLVGLALLGATAMTLTSCIKSAPANSSGSVSTPSQQEPQASSSGENQTPSQSSEGSNVTPSASNNEATPSASNTADVTPSTSNGGNVTPSQSQNNPEPSQSGNDNNDTEESTGFGTGYTAWSDLFAGKTRKDSKNRVYLGATDTEEVTRNGFTFIGKCVLDNSLMNTNGTNIKVTLPSSGSINMTATWGSTSDSGVIKVYNASNEVIYTSTTTYSKDSSSVTLELSNLPAGVYTIDAEKTTSTGTAGLKISKIYYSAEIEYVSVSVNPNNGETVNDLSVRKGGTVSAIPTVQKSGYRLLGWYTTSTFDAGTEFTTSTVVSDDVTIYAKWEELTTEDLADISFEVNITDVTYDQISIEKGTTLTLPTTKNVSGYRFAGWYTSNTYQTQFNASTTISTNTTLYGKYIQQVTITYKDSLGNVVTTKNVDYETAFSNVEKVTAPYVEGKIFEYWVKEGTTVEFTGTEDITTNVTLVAKYRDQTPADVTINYTAQEGLYEAAYVTFSKYDAAEGYALYMVNADNSQTKLTNKDYYVSETTTEARIDIFGLEAGNYTFMVAPIIGGEDVIGLGKQTKSIAVEAYDRSGFAHFNYTSGVGAYKDNGELKDNAIVLYVTDDNKNTVQLTYGGKTVTGIGNILNSSGQETTEAGHEGQCKRTSEGSTYYGKANSNQGIIKILAEANIPLVVRFIGCVSSSGLYQQGVFDASKAPLIDGLTYFNSWDNGGTYKNKDGDQGHMARMQSGKNITLEGVGSGATIDGWGFHFICSKSDPTLGKNFEVRNLKFINTPEDAIGMEGDQEGGVINASVERCWIHNNEFYCPNIGPTVTEGDKHQGDGSCDFKRGQYFTCSYNYFEYCHKTMLVGSSDSSLQFNLTYHHNYFYMCGSRGPLARQANIHMYNNYFYGQTDYAMNPRANAYIFSEYNLFYACKNPMTIKTGAIKSYNDMFASYVDDRTATFVDNKSEVVSNQCKYGDIDYSKFDTNSNQSYIPSNDYYLQDDYLEIRKTLEKCCGTAKESLSIEYSLNDLSILNSLKLNPTINNLSTGNTVAPGKISKTVYAFKITEYATITISTTGLLVNEAGILILEGSGTEVLAPGTYFVQAKEFQPGSESAALVFKDFNIESIKLEKYDSTELNNALKEAYINAVASIPTNIEYNDSCYNAIKNAMTAYNALTAALKAEVDYSTVETSLASYKALGVTYVEGLISAIGTVDSNSGTAIQTARTAYDNLKAKISDASVSNYETLTAAENSFKTFAVDACKNAIDAIGTVTLSSKDAIEYAEGLYNSLDSTQKSQVSNYSTLETARTTYNSLKNVADVNALIADADTVAKYEEACTAYNALTSAEKAQVAGFAQMMVSYVIAKIDSIPATVSKTDKDLVTACRDLYDSLDADSKSNVTNYSKLTDAETALSQFNSEQVTKAIAVSAFNITGTTATTITGSVWTGNSVVAITKAKLESVSKVVVNATRKDGSVFFEVYYSADGTTWTQVADKKQPGSNNTATDLTFDISGDVGEVYIKVVISGTKTNGSNAKVGTINSVTCTYYE